VADFVAERRERSNVAGHAVVAVVPAQALTQSPMLLDDRRVPVSPELLAELGELGLPLLRLPGGGFLPG
jgi:hypothetical protein